MFNHRLRTATIRILVAAPLMLVAVGCGSLEAIGDFPNPKDTVTVYTTPPPQAPASEVVATVPASGGGPVAGLGR